jgi:enterobactin synthetase component F
MVNISTSATPASAALREVAADDPGRIALEVEEHQVSYAELNDQADRLARRLVAGCADGSRVAIRAAGTYELTVGFLAVQRAGLVSVPIDPTAPPDRVRTILGEVEPSVLLSDVGGDDSIGLGVAVRDPLRWGADLDPEPIDRPRGALVSVVYTSGSTGTPKGIMVSRSQIESQFASLDLLRAIEASRIGAITAGTAGYIEQLVGSFLVFHGTLVSYEIRRRGLTGLASWVESSEIVAFATVPTVLRHLLSTTRPDQRFPLLRLVVLSGETAVGDDVRRMRRHLGPGAVMMNSFGLTETAGIASLTIPHDAPVPDGPLPVGTVSTDLEVVIVDPAGSSVPSGHRGEIVVRGQALALGYWRRPDLTQASFSDLGDGGRELRTGDAGRLLPDGTLEHLGRLDHLVKISGNRVELGEVEAALTRLDAVAAAAAAPYPDDQGGTRLAACVVPAAGAKIDPGLLRAALSRQLPGYMVPTRIAVADSLPQLTGGKVDRRLVAEMPVAPAVTDDGILDGLERRLARLWCRILDIERVGRNDDFFRLGGDSLDAARLFVEIESELGIDCPVSVLPEAPTVASLAATLGSGTDGVWDALLPVWTEGSEPPLFVVHDGIGSVLYARGLAAALGPDQPIYGLRCAALRGSPVTEQSLAELAGGYADKIQALYPRGPYRLYGVSLGGVVAMEMARQLIERGEQVPLVVLGDSAAPGMVVRPRSPKELVHHLRTLRRTPPRERWSYTRSVLEEKLVWLLGAEGRQMRAEDRALDELLRVGGAVPASLRGRYVIRRYGSLLVGHRADPPFPERTVLLRAGRAGQSADRGWRPLLGESLHLIQVPGTHNDLGREASGVYVGPALARVLSGSPLEAQSETRLTASGV